MSTRRLILTALIAGLAILIAGGVFLFRLSTGKDDLVSEVRSVGEPATIGSVTVAPTAVTRNDGRVQTVIEVTVGATAPDGTVAERFALLQRTRRPAVAPVGAADPACETVSFTANTSVRCALAYSGDGASAFLSYSDGGRQVQWRI
jgi:hypothetical protein